MIDVEVKRNRGPKVLAETATPSRLERTFATATLMPWSKGFVGITRQLVYVRYCPIQLHSVTVIDTATGIVLQ